MNSPKRYLIKTPLAFLFALIFFFVVGNQKIIYAANFQNGGMEDSFSCVPNSSIDCSPGSWIKYGNTQWQRETTIKHGGNLSVKYSGGDGGHYQQFDVVQDATYKISGYSFRYYNKSADWIGLQHGGTPLDGTSRDWYNLYATNHPTQRWDLFEIIVIPTSPQLTLYLKGKNDPNDNTSDSNDVYFDDISVVQTLPPPPTNLSSSCPAPGTSATLTWSASAGATYYALRVDDHADFWDCATQPGDRCPNVTSTTYMFSSAADHEYFWWLHACNSNGCASNFASGTIFTCAPYPTPTLGSLTINEAVSGQAGTFSGASKTSGKSDSTGKKWLNPMTVSLSGPVTSDSIKFYAVGFYKQSLGSATSLDQIRQWIDSDNNNGILLAYAASACDNSTNCDVDGTSTSFAAGKSYVYKKGSGWIEVTSSADYTDVSGYYGVRKGIGANWVINLDSSFTSKAMYTARYVASDGNRNAFSADTTPN